MDYLKVENGVVVKAGLQRAHAERDIRSLYPNVSLPSRLPEETLDEHGYVQEHPTPVPQGDVVTQGQPEERGGKWYQTWIVREFTAEELEQQRLASIPQTISPRQARLALLQAGLLSQVDTAINSLESPAKEQTQIEWEYATSIERSSEWINQLGGALGLDDAGIDDLFKQAAEL